MNLSPYPLIYCPDGIPRPPCCAHQGGVDCVPGKGPDTIIAPDGTTLGGSGRCWGGSLPTPGTVVWTKSPAGWYIALAGSTPQALRRMVTHPRILRWLTIPGAIAGQRWRVPVLLTRDRDGDTILAIDRVLTVDGWREPDDLTNLTERLWAVALGTHLHEDPAARNAAVVQLAIDILSLGQWFDADLAKITGWISEEFLIRVVQGALNAVADNPLDAQA